MFGVCLFRESGEQWENQWSYLIRHFSPDWVYVIGDSLPKTKSFSNAILIQAVDDLPKDISLVVFAPINARYYSGKKNLFTFKHPEKSIYLFGADTGWLKPEEFLKRKPDHRVYIPTDTDDDMYSWVAGGIVFFDRRSEWPTR